jgi:hypothetical protein
MITQSGQSLTNAATRAASIGITAFVVGNLMVIATLILALLIL